MLGYSASVLSSCRLVPNASSNNATSSIPASFLYYILSNPLASVMPQTKAIVSIENVVASASINQRVDLNEITKKFVDVEYHPETFPGLVFRLKVPKTATLVFSSGKMVCTGARSEERRVGKECRSRWS